MLPVARSSTRAGALGAFALFFGALVGAGCAAPPQPLQLAVPKTQNRALDDSADFSVFLARNDIEEKCDESGDCSNPRYIQVLEPLEWIAGNSQIERLTQEIIAIGRPSTGGLNLVHAERRTGGQWAVVETAPLRLNACLKRKPGTRYDQFGLEGSLWSQEISKDARRICLERSVQLEKR